MVRQRQAFKQCARKSTGGLAPRRILRSGTASPSGSRSSSVSRNPSPSCPSEAETEKIVEKRCRVGESESGDASSTIIYSSPDARDVETTPSTSKSPEPESYHEPDLLDILQKQRKERKDKRIQQKDQELLQKDRELKQKDRELQLKNKELELLAEMLEIKKKKQATLEDAIKRKKQRKIKNLLKLTS